MHDFEQQKWKNQLSITYFPKILLLYYSLLLYNILVCIFLFRINIYIYFFFGGGLNFDVLTVMVSMK